MKIAVVYNRESRNVINLFGTPNRERIGLKTIKRITDALKKAGHQVIALEGDKDLIDRLEDFMPRVIKGERPGLVFNVSYGIQGQARYTHVPSILEMVGIPYVASGPLAHSLCLDKVVTKMVLRQSSLPTPDFAVLDRPDADVPDLPYPMIVKPKNEAVSFGLRVVNNEAEMREGARVIFEKFEQPVLVEQFIEGREINVGLLGNSPPETFPPVELIFDGEGPAIYTYEDKTGRSGRTISHRCPAPIGEKLLAHAQDISRRAFTALGCADCARVDMRLDASGNLYILEVNSLPSLGEHGSYTIAAEHVGLDYPALVNRIVEAASARYFGTPEPPRFEKRAVEPADYVHRYITLRRDEMERRIRDWSETPSHTTDPIGLQESVRRLNAMLQDVGLRPVRDLTDERSVRTWQTPAGLNGGTLFIGHLDVPMESEISPPAFRREPEWLFGDGIGVTRGSLVMLEYVLRALRSARLLRKMPLGVLYYTDEGRDARYSASMIRDASGRAGRVLVLRPGSIGNHVVTQRRGQRKYRFRITGEPMRPGRRTRKTEVMRWVFQKLEEFSRLGSAQKRMSVSAVDVRTERLPLLLPHRVTATILMTYPDAKVADDTERQMRAALGSRGPRWELESIVDRPPMSERRTTARLYRSLEQIAQRWEIPLDSESSVWPSVAGLVPAKIPCLCGVGPVARDLGTPHEAMQRISLVQRTLLLAEYLASTMEK
jgi:D-alanine-D-alanine ligase